MKEQKIFKKDLSMMSMITRKMKRFTQRIDPNYL